MEKIKDQVFKDLGIALNGQNIGKSREVTFCTLSKPDYPHGGNDKVLTLLISVDVEDVESRHTWSAAKRDCLAVLESYGIDDVEVEIVDPHKTFGPSLFSIPPWELRIQCYESFRDDLMDFIHQELRDSWISICLWRVGNTFKRSAFKIVVMVKPLAVHDWQSLIHEIEKRFISKASRGLNDMGVIFIPGSCGTTPTDKTGGKSLMPEDGDLPLYPRRGSSIGVVGERGGGTFGGFFNLSKISSRDSSPRRCALTTAHVVRPAQSASVEVRSRYDIEGVLTHTHPQDPRRVTVHYPIAKDLEATITHLQNCTETATVGARIARIERKIKEAEEDWGFRKPQKWRSILEDEKKSIARDRASLDACDKMPINVGQVCFSTGRGLTAHNKILDFAFVEPLNPEMKAQSHQIDSYTPLRDGRSNLRQLKQLDDDKHLWVCDMGQIHKGEWYFKYGRTTGFTGGICNGTEAFVNMGGHRTRYGVDGQRGEFQTCEFIKEFVIATPNERQLREQELMDLSSGTAGLSLEPEKWALHTQKDFLESGDSGALVVNADGDACGLLFGSLNAAVGPFEWDPICDQLWEEEEEKSPEKGNHSLLGVQSDGDHLGNAKQAGGDMKDGHALFGPSCGLVTSMHDIVEHLRMSAGLELDLF